MTNNYSLVLLIFLLILLSCKPTINKAKAKNEILLTEKAFEKMAVDSGIAIAFRTFAADSAVILRGNDSIIRGSEGIYNYYSQQATHNASVNWTPDYIEVSDDGTLGYTYGKYLWKVRQKDNSTKEFRGIFHTVWKKQTDGSWKYVWD